MCVLPLLACLVLLLVPGANAAPASTCILIIEGAEDTRDIMGAAMICTGPAPAVALDSYLQMFADNFLGVETTNEDCQSSDKKCLLRFCGDANLMLSTDITNLRLGHVDAVLCIASHLEVTIKNSTFQYNTATANLITVEARATLNTDHVRFKKNVADSGGWGGSVLRLSNATLNIRNTFFVGNSAAISGGAVSAFGSVVIVTDSDFSLNTAPTGGAILVNRSMLFLDNTTFESNEAESSGGAVAVLDASAVDSMVKAFDNYNLGSSPPSFGPRTSSSFGPSNSSNLLSSILSVSESVPVIGLSIVNCNFSHNNVRFEHGGGLAVDTVDRECIVTSSGTAVVFFIQGTTFDANIGNDGSALSARLHSNEKLIIANSTVHHNAQPNYGATISAFPTHAPGWDDTCFGGSVEVREVSFTSNAWEGLLAARNTPLKFVGKSQFYGNAGSCVLQAYESKISPRIMCPDAGWQGRVCMDVNGTVLSVNGDVTGAPRLRELCKSEEALKHIAIVYSMFAALVLGISICGVVIGCQHLKLRRGMVPQSPVQLPVLLASSKAPAALPVTSNAAVVTSCYCGGGTGVGVLQCDMSASQESCCGSYACTRSSSLGRSRGGFVSRIGAWMHGPGGYQLLGLARCTLMLWDLISDIIVLVNLYGVSYYVTYYEAGYSSSLWVAYLILLFAANMIATLILHLRLVALARNTTTTNTTSSSSGCGGKGIGRAYPSSAASFGSLRPYFWMASWVGCGVCGQVVQLLFPWVCYLFIIDHPMMWAHAATSRRLKRGSAPGVDLTLYTPPPEQQQQQRGGNDQQQQHRPQQHHQQQQQQQRCCTCGTCCCCSSKTTPPTPKAAAFPWLHLEHYASLHSFWLTLVESIPTTAITTWAYHAGAAPGRPLVINTWLFYFSTLPALLGVAYWYGLLLIKGVQGELKEEFRAMFWGVVRVSPGGSPGDGAGATGVTSGKHGGGNEVVDAGGAGRGDVELATASAAAGGGGGTVLPRPAAAGP